MKSLKLAILAIILPLSVPTAAAMANGPEHPGNCITGSRDPSFVSRETFVVYTDNTYDEFLALIYGGQGTEVRSPIRILDQGTVEGIPFYVVEYLNGKGQKVIHHCYVAMAESLPAWW